ncbi:MAG TPA: MmcQ/YjbR family DNA-binding protein, partial [Terriglobia bacterium]|nr:MmcQ/YjbR family DNA-binding protein [Terriglobia bacterium]
RRQQAAALKSWRARSCARIAPPWTSNGFASAACLCRTPRSTCKWGIDLVFKIGGKMYAVMPTEPAPVCLSFKCSDENFAELVERPGIIPAPYLARAKWVALQNESALSRAELGRLLGDAYELVLANLPRSVQVSLGKAPSQRTAKKRAKANQRRR